MATREKIAGPDEPIHSPEVPVHDNGDDVGRITLPKNVRDVLGIELGDELKVEAYRDRIEVRPKEE